MFVFRATSAAGSAGDVVETDGAASAVANEKLKFAAGWSGGSPVSTSLMLAATAVTVQCAAGRWEAGGRGVVCEAAAPTSEEGGVPSQTSVKEDKVVVTGSREK